MKTIHDLIKEDVCCFDDIETADLTALIHRCKDKRVVLLGEASHGNVEYYRMRARITQELIAKEGFSIVACEGDWPDFEEVDRFVRGQPIRAVPFQRFPVWMWKNRDFFQFLEWSRSYNEEAHQKVRFYGLDLYGMCRNIEEVVHGLDIKAPSLALLAAEKLRGLHALGIEPHRYYRSLQSGGPSFQGAVQEIFDAGSRVVEQDEGSFHLLQNLRFLKLAEEAIRNIDQGSLHWNLRARQMYDALQAVLGFHGSGAKAIVWAHNTHVGHTGVTPMGLQGLCNIGTLCKEAYGEQAYAIGFGSYRGRVTAAMHWEGPEQIQEIPPASDQSYEYLFYETGLKQFSLFLRQGVKEHLREKRLARSIGTIYQGDPSGNYYPTCLPEQFDEFIWFETVSPVATAS